MKRFLGTMALLGLAWALAADFAGAQSAAGFKSDPVAYFTAKAQRTWVGKGTFFGKHYTDTLSFLPSSGGGLSLRRTLVIVFAAVILFQIVLWSWGLLGGFLFNLLLAWLIAISFDPVVSALAQRGMRRGLATAIVAISMLILLGGFIALFGSILATQVAGLVLAVPALLLDIVAWINSTFDAQIDPVELTNSEMGKTIVVTFDVLEPAGNATDANVLNTAAVTSAALANGLPANNDTDAIPAGGTLADGNVITGVGTIEGTLKQTSRMP